MKRLHRDLWEMKETRVALILSLALLLSVILYCFATRYNMVGSEATAYMYDRITGRCWFYRPGYYVPVKPRGE
jgi:uncharacterized membrane protein SpoIIM required for sporulation